MKFPSYRTLATCGLAVLFMGASGPGSAEKSDRSKPMNVEADSLKIDDLKQTSVFTGRVVLTQGSIIIRGAQIEVRQDPQGYQFGTVTAEPGKLAFFRQKRDSVDEFIEGESEVIEYDGKADTVKFLKRAQLRRYKGAVLNDEMAGGLIFYDNTTDIFTIDGGVTQGTPGLPGGRIKVLLMPKANPEATSQPGTVVAPVQPGLRSSPALAPEKK